ncbi:MAG: nucleoside hydrolase [Phycicoccus sp.]|nr:nucleoside hydrolase [Phycicoccus sp.]
MHTRPLILDTDIGTDVDDAMALSQILGSPAVHLDSVTTVYGDTHLRAQIAWSYGRLAGRHLRVHPGEGVPRTGREIYWPGHEGTLQPDLQTARVEPIGAVDHLISSLAARPGELDVVAIGPLTNLASALEREPSVARWIRHLWLMAGDFSGGDEAEHNVLSDSASAAMVFASGVPTTVTGTEVTRKLRIEAEGLARIGAAGALGAALHADMQQWWAYWQETWNVPHDPVTVLTLTHPHLFTFSPVGRVEVVTSGSGEGRTRFVPDPAGATRLTQSINGAAAAEEMIAAIERAGSLAGAVIEEQGPGGLDLPATTNGTP